jgi:hypothetical protein
MAFGALGVEKGKVVQEAVVTHGSGSEGCCADPERMQGSRECL